MDEGLLANRRKNEGFLGKIRRIGEILKILKGFVGEI